MEWMGMLSQFWTEHHIAILATLLGISEALANLPWFKSNSILELVIAALRKMAGK